MFSVDVRISQQSAQSTVAMMRLCSSLLPLLVIASSVSGFVLDLHYSQSRVVTMDDTPVLVETTEDDLLLTFAASDVTRLTNTTLERHKKVAVFGEVWDLVTVKYWAPYITLLSVLQCLEFLTSEC